jgi:hypothetical protein
MHLLDLRTEIWIAVQAPIALKSTDQDWSPDIGISVHASNGLKPRDPD